MPPKFKAFFYDMKLEQQFETLLGASIEEQLDYYVALSKYKHQATFDENIKKYLETLIGREGQTAIPALLKRIKEEEPRFRGALTPLFREIHDHSYNLKNETAVHDALKEQANTAATESDRATFEDALKYIQEQPGYSASSTALVPPGGAVAPPVNVDGPPPPTPKPVPKAPISGGVLNGKATSLPKPPYPAAARSERASGTVVVQVTVDENGSVISANAVSGHPLLHAAAVSAARQAKFSPTKLSGQPVKITGLINYNFVLE
jgi:TonB family protein